MRHSNLPPDVISVKEKDFASILREATTPIILDVWADWCGPCHEQAPVLNEFAAQFPSDVKVYKIQIEQAPTFVKQFDIAHVPTMLLFERGKPVTKLVGFQTKQQLEKVICK